MKKILGFMLLFSFLGTELSAGNMKISRRGFLFGIGATAIPTIVQMPESPGNVIEFVSRFRPALSPDDPLFRLGQMKFFPKGILYSPKPPVIRFQEVAKELGIDNAPKYVPIPDRDLLFSPPSVAKSHWSQLYAPRVGAEWENLTLESTMHRLPAIRTIARMLTPKGFEGVMSLLERRAINEAAQIVAAVEEIESSKARTCAVTLNAKKPQSVLIIEGD